MRFKNLVIALTSLICLATCDKLPSNSSMRKSLPLNPDLVMLKPVDAIIRESGEKPISVERSRIDIKQEFTSAQFVSSDLGWVAASRSLYKTSDGGRTWRLIPLELSPHSHILSFFFIDELRGWLTIRTESFVQGSSSPPVNASRMMATNNGGLVWTEQANFHDNVMIDYLRFLNANDGLATGARVIDGNPPYEEIFLAQTRDGGRHWNDISEKVKPAFKNEGGIASGYGCYINWVSSQILLLSKFGRIVQSTDQGETWERLVQLKDQRPNGLVSSIGYSKVFATKQQRIRVVAGGTGDEGYWGDLIVNDENNSWTSLELSRIPILDAVFLSDDEILACGKEIQAYDEKSKSRGSPVGIILHSIDKGKSWAPIYRSKTNETFIFLTKFGTNEFYSVSDLGTFLRFRLAEP